jgi:hypothetical protein
VAIVLGVLIGLLVGAAVCARYLRQEIAANIGPRLQRIEVQLGILRAELDNAELNLTTELRRAVTSRRRDQGEPDN